MRAQGLLSPHRGRQGEMKAHDGTIVTGDVNNVGRSGTAVAHAWEERERERERCEIPEVLR